MTVSAVDTASASFTGYDVLVRYFYLSIALSLSLSLSLFPSLRCESILINDIGCIYSGTDGVDVFSSYLVNFAGGDFQASAEMVDFDSFGDFSLSSTGNIRMRGGRVANFQGNNVNLSGTSGADIISTDSSNKFNAATGFTATATNGNLGITALDDVTLLSSTNTQVNAASTLTATGPSFQLLGSTVNVAFTTVNVAGGAVSVGGGAVSLGGGTAGSVSLTGTSKLSGIASVR
mgnify:CR=1 FL=1